MEKRKFYRVQDIRSEGLWYNQEGAFTGLIHTKHSNLASSKLEMPMDDKIIGYLSVADSLSHLFQWFSREEIAYLQQQGYVVSEYECEDVKFYDLYQHNIINKSTARLTRIVTLDTHIST